MNLSFAGCGFMGLYHVGAAACIQTFAPFLLRNKMAGASAGSMIAAALIGEVSLVVVARDVLDLVVTASEKIMGPFSPTFNLNTSLKEGLHRVLPDNIHILANNRLHISLTRASDGKNIIVSTFESKEELVNAILGSSFIPFFSGFIPPRYKGDLVVDGGYSDNVPTLQENTITISPFHGNQDICPLSNSKTGAILNFSTGPTTSVAVTMENIQRLQMAMIPPKLEDLLKVCQQGFDDAFAYLSSRNVVQCATCRASKAELTNMEEWRLRPGRDDCAECDALLSDPSSASLPSEIRQVFQDVLEDMRQRNSGLLATVSWIASTPYNVSTHLAFKSLDLVNALLPSEKIMKILGSLAPGLADDCPFALV